MELTAQYLESLLSYDPASGEFRWRVRRGLARPGMVAGTTTRGYVVIRINGKNYGAHRLAWLYMHRRWPTNQIDHINGDPSDNRLSNLRECDHSGNQQNSRARSNNKTGFPGVYLHKSSGLYTGEVTVRGHRVSLGYYHTPERAHEAYLRAKADRHLFAPDLRKQHSVLGSGVNDTQGEQI